MSDRRDSPRFTDWSIVDQTGSTGLVDDRRPFFGGTDVDSRMRLVRKQISHIRRNWDQYDEFMAGLAARMSGRIATLGAEADLARSLLTDRRDWAGAEDVVTDFSAIKLYTSDAGYRALFGVVNDSLRRAGFLHDEHLARDAVFLIELLTIDLFNYAHTHPQTTGFEGVVYRGMSVSTDDADVFLNVMSQPLAQRFVSVPLGILSSSTDPDVALRLANTYASVGGSRTTVLWKIHVLDLGDDLMHLYRRTFPASVVTSICAVPIAGLSRYPGESEVLLRGPFFQILDVGHGPDMLVIDAVMLNSNRDHVTNIADERDDDRAKRDLFRVLVTQRRAKFAAEFTAGRDRIDDSRSYRRQWEASLAELRTLGFS